MTHSEIKTWNLRRICAEKHINATELGKLLGAGKAHGSNLLRGKSGIGPETIKKLCAQWTDVTETDFLISPKGGKGEEGVQVKYLQKFIDNLEKDVERLEKANKELRARIAVLEGQRPCGDHRRRGLEASSRSRRFPVIRGAKVVDISNGKELFTHTHTHCNRQAINSIE